MCGLRVYLYARLKSFSAAKVTVETWKSNVAILERGQIQKKFVDVTKAKTKYIFCYVNDFGPFNAETFIWFGGLALPGSGNQV